MVDDRLDDLLLAWEDLYEKGQDVPADQLCAGEPELAAPLAERIAELKRVGWLNAAADRTGGSPPASPAAMAPPDPLAGRYRLDGLLGGGGFGQVWRGFDLELQRPVAVKLPRPGRPRASTAEGGFLAEARKVARLDHPGIVPVYDVVRHDGAHAIIMGLIDGTDLGRYAAARRPTAREAARIVAEVAGALEYAHRQGVVHRDIKPSNVLLDRQRRVYLTDFGIAASAEGPAGLPAQTCGTVAYMAPELLAGRPGQTGARGDVYSLGVVLHELLTGACPGDATVNLRGPAAVQGPLPSSGPADHPCLEPICRKCLARHPGDRYASAGELADALRHCLVGLLNEADWQNCTDPAQMLSHLFNLGAPARKLRLFACHCLRQEWSRLLDGRSRQAVDVAERYAEGQATDAELRAARAAAWEASTSLPAQAAAWAVNGSAWTAAWESTRFTGRHLQASLLHDLFGPSLFVPVALDPAWLAHNGGAARRLAQAIYEEQAFERMPLLADALLDAGCTDQVILGHCRGEGPHVRGCWLVDLLTGRGGEAVGA